MSLSLICIIKVKLWNMRFYCIKKIIFSYYSSQDSEFLLHIRNIKKKLFKKEIKFSIISTSFSKSIWFKLKRRMNILSILQYLKFNNNYFISLSLSSSIHNLTSYRYDHDVLQQKRLLRSNKCCEDESLDNKSTINSQEGNSTLHSYLVYQQNRYRPRIYLWFRAYLVEVQRQQDHL